MMSSLKSLLESDKSFNLKREMNIPITFDILTFEFRITCDGKDVTWFNLKDKSITGTSLESIFGKHNLENRQLKNKY